MPTYRVTDPNTGTTLKLTGDSPPSEKEIMQAFEAYGGRQGGRGEAKGAASEFATGVGRGLAKLAGGIGQRLGAYSQEDIDAAMSAMETERKGEGWSGKVGEFVGEVAPTFLVPGGGIAGGIGRRALTSGLSGALVGAAEPTKTGESAGMNVALGAASGAGVSGLLSGAGKVFNVATGNVAKTAESRLSEKFGIRTTLGEATNNPLTKRIETWLDAIPIVGLKGFREKQQAEAESAAKSFLAKYIVDPASGDIEASNRAFASKLFQDLDATVSGVASQPILPSETRAAAKALTDRYPDIFKRFQDTRREGIINSIISDTAPVKSPILNQKGVPYTKPMTATFAELWELRHGLGEMIGQAKKQLASGSVDKTTLGELSKLYSAVNNDIDGWAKSIGRSDIRTAINAANDAYKQYVVKYDVIQRAVDKATGKVGSNESFSPKTFSTELKRIANKDRSLGRFSSQEIDEMTGLFNIMQVVKESGQYMYNPATGNRWAPLTAGVGIVGASGLAAGAQGVALTATPVLIARFLTGTKAGKNLAMSASKIEPASPAMARIMEQVYRQAPKIAAAGATMTESGMEDQ